MQMKLFVAGTDTDVGKTYISVGLLKGLSRLGLVTLGVKPIASGCVQIDNVLYNNDALSLSHAASIKLSYDVINPFAFEPPIAPHIAARQANRELNLQLLNQKSHHALNYPADVCIIEGAGGWYVPLNRTETIANFVTQNNLKVLLVIGIKLGCINHALLTFKAMQQDGADIIGWIANCIDPNMTHANENISTLQNWLPLPCLGVVKHNSCVEDSIDIGNIIKLSSK